MRPTTDVVLTLDAHPGERAAWDALARKEQRLVRDREKLPTAKRGPLTREIDEARAQMDALAATIQSGQVRATVTGLSRGGYRNLLKGHPPRDDESLDERLGYNADTFGAALVEACTIEAHTLDGDPVPLDVPAWVDDETGVGPGDFEAWFRACLALQTTRASQVPLRRAS